MNNGSQGGTPWVCFIIKDKKSPYSDGFGRTPDNFLFNQLGKPIIYQNYKNQIINSKFSGS